MSALDKVLESYRLECLRSGTPTKFADLAAAELAALTAALDRAQAEAREAREALQFVDTKLSYLQNLWGKEGVTDGIVDRVREALAATEPKP